MAPLKTLGLVLGVAAALTIGTIEALLRGRLESLTLRLWKRSAARQQEELARALAQQHAVILEQQLDIARAISGSIGGKSGLGFDPGRWSSARY